MIKEIEKNEIENNIENNLINNDNESSFEILNGEEEDEDDLLKSESETNKSSNKEIDKEMNKPIIEELKQNDNQIMNEKQQINVNNTNKEINPALLKDSIDSMFEEINDKRSKSSDSNNEKSLKNEKDESKEEESDEEEEEEDDAFGDTVESVNLYELYLDSQTNISNKFQNFNEGDYIYGIKKNSYYLYLQKLPFKQKIFLFIKAQQDEETERKHIILMI